VRRVTARGMGAKRASATGGCSPADPAVISRSARPERYTARPRQHMSHRGVRLFPIERGAGRTGSAAHDEAKPESRLEARS
jgi:hypothetical protein